MSCDEFESLAIEALDGALGAEHREAFDRHAEQCAHCREFLETQCRLDEALGAAIAAPVLSAAFERRLRERIAGERNRWSWLETANRIGVASVVLAGLSWGMGNLSGLTLETMAVAAIAATSATGLWLLLPERLRSVLNPFRSV